MITNETMYCVPGLKNITLLYTEILDNNVKMPIFMLKFTIFEFFKANMVEHPKGYDHVTFFQIF